MKSDNEKKKKQLCKISKKNLKSITKVIIYAISMPSFVKTPLTGAVPYVAPSWK
jgi:hypothetical protein